MRDECLNLSDNFPPFEKLEKKIKTKTIEVLFVKFTKERTINEGQRISLLLTHDPLLYGL